MKILVTGGGTAGHVTPLLAVASELKHKDSTVRIRYIGQRKDPMTELVTQSNSFENQYHIFAGKFRRYHGLTFRQKLQNISMYFQNIRDILYVVIGFVQSFFIILTWRPRVVFIKGGFVGLPVGLAASLLRVPIVTHDSDVVPGLTNRIVGRFAAKNAVAMPIDNYLKYYSAEKLIQTGVPIRAEYFDLTAESKVSTRKSFGIELDAHVVTIIGGSLGADGLNTAIEKALPELMSDEKITLLWVTGKKQNDRIRESVAGYNAKMERIRLFAFVSDLFGLMDAADLVISRAGATSIAELAATAKPTILIPSPYLVGNHQVKNSEALAVNGAVIYLDETQVLSDTSLLVHHIRHVLNDNSESARLSSAIASLSTPHSSSDIADVLLSFEGR